MPKQKRLTPDEWLKKAQALFKQLPKGHWLFAASGQLYLVKGGPDGERIIDQYGGMDPDAAVGSIIGPIDGGDW